MGGRWRTDTGREIRPLPSVFVQLANSWPGEAAKATAVVEAFTGITELKSKMLGGLCSLTSTIHVAFYV
jgi:hypothetical protein